MENPGSFKEQTELYPELPDGDVLRLYEGALARWKQYCQERTDDVILPPTA